MARGDLLLMSILDGGLLIGGDTPTPDTPDTPDTPETPVSKRRDTVKGHTPIATAYAYDGTLYRVFNKLNDWDLINPVQTWTRFEHENLSWHTSRGPHNH